MRKLSVLILLVFSLWGGYWFVGSSALENGLKEYLSSEHSQKDPIQIEYSDLSVRGFPNRFDTRLSNISLTDTKNGISWRAPFLHVYALSYKPYHIIAALPHDQTLQLPTEELRITSDEIKGSVVFSPNSLLDSALEVDRTSFVMRNVVVSSDLGWKTEIGKGTFATRQTAANPLHYDLAFSADSISLPDQLRLAIDPNHQNSDVFDKLNFDGTLAVTNPWNLLASGQNQPVITEINVTDLTIIWDNMRFQAVGTLHIDRNGFPNGKLNLTAFNWQQMYQLAKNADAVDPDFAQTIQNGLKVLAGMSENESKIQAPLNFANGTISLGPLPIGPAPRLY